MSFRFDSVRFRAAGLLRGPPGVARPPAVAPRLSASLAVPLRLRGLPNLRKLAGRSLPQWLPVDLPRPHALRLLLILRMETRQEVLKISYRRNW